MEIHPFAKIGCKTSDGAMDVAISLANAYKCRMYVYIEIPHDPSMSAKHFVSSHLQQPTKEVIVTTTHLYEVANDLVLLCIVDRTIQQPSIRNTVEFRHPWPVIQYKTVYPERGADFEII